MMDTGIALLSWLFEKLSHSSSLRFDSVDGSPPVNLLPAASICISFLDKFPTQLGKLPVNKLFDIKRSLSCLQLQRLFKKSRSPTRLLFEISRILRDRSLLKSDNCHASLPVRLSRVKWARPIALLLLLRCAGMHGCTPSGMGLVARARQVSVFTSLFFFCFVFPFEFAIDSKNKVPQFIFGNFTQTRDNIEDLGKIISPKILINLLPYLEYFNYSLFYFELVQKLNSLQSFWENL